MRTNLIQFLDQVNQLLEKCKNAEALAAVRNTDIRKIDGLTSEDCSDYYYAYARCLFRVGQHSKALYKIKVALKLSQTGANHLLYASQKQLLGLIYGALGRREEAIEAHTEAYVSRKRAGDYKNIYASLVNLGLAHFVKGELRRAAEVLEQGLKCAKRYNSEDEIRICALNLARVLLFGGEFSRSRAILDSIQVTAAIDRARISELEGILAVFARDAEKASTTLNQASSWYREVGAQRELAVCLEFVGLNEYFQGRYDKSKNLFQQVLAMPEPRASAVAQTLRMLTDVHIAEDDFDRAKETAAKAEEAINKISERIELGALYRAYGQIYEHDGVRDKAHDYFVKSIDLLRELGAKYELALSYLAAGRSACYNDAVRLEHLHQAKVLFAEMDVPKRMAQVGEEIQKLVGARRAVAAIHTPNSSREGNKKAKGAPPPAVGNIPTIITQNKRMLEILAQVEKIKDLDMTILITGETGTGKDLLAEYIHYTSKRSAKPLISLNSATMKEELLESELFGTRRGSYTGALDKVGLIEAADGGTFFFNEIAEAPLSIQAKLLDVIETKRLRRLGDAKDVKVDVRFIAASNQNLAKPADRGQFRGDLYFRLQQMAIELPPLRERKDDLPLLIEHFLAEVGFGINPLSTDQLNALLRGLHRYSWPGNVRELRSAIFRAAALVSGSDAQQLTEVLSEQLVREVSDQTYKNKLLTALERNGGNLSKAARELGLHEATSRYHLKKLHDESDS